MLEINTKQLEEMIKNNEVDFVKCNENLGSIGSYDIEADNNDAANILKSDKNKVDSISLTLNYYFTSLKLGRIICKINMQEKKGIKRSYTVAVPGEKLKSILTMVNWENSLSVPDTARFFNLLMLAGEFHDTQNMISGLTQEGNGDNATYKLTYRGCDSTKYKTIGEAYSSLKQHYIENVLGNEENENQI